jgi:hypothetical protein
MPNQANRSNGNSSAGKGSPRHEPNRDRGEQRSNNERSDVKRNTNKSDNNTSRTSNEGRKRASGGNS